MCVCVVCARECVYICVCVSSVCVCVLTPNLRHMTVK